MSKRKSTKYLVIHCSATRAIQAEIDANTIRKWHKGQGWADIGYHFVIKRDGTLESGRPLDQVGAHVANHNSYSVGICLVGGLANAAPFKPENNFTKMQWITLRQLLKELLQKYPDAKVLGHRDFPKVAKVCPCFDARQWAKDNGFPASPKLR